MNKLRYNIKAQLRRQILLIKSDKVSSRVVANLPGVLRILIIFLF